MVCLDALIGMSVITPNVSADNVVVSATGDLNITTTQVNMNTYISLMINLTGEGDVSNINITAPTAFDGGNVWVKDINIYIENDLTWYYGVENSSIYGISGSQRYANITLTTFFNSTSLNDKIVVNYTAIAGGIPTTNALFTIELFNGTGSDSGPTTIIADGNLNVDVLDTTPPDIIETTTSPATTGEYYNISADVTDNVAVDTVWLEYNMTSIDGYYQVNNVSMLSIDPLYWWNMTLWDNATWFNYTISANDTSDNWNTSIDNVVVNDNDNPSLDADNCADVGTTGDNFFFDVNVSDNIGVSSVNVSWSHGSLNGNDPLIDDGDGTWNHAITLDDSIGDLTYSVQVNDTSLNDVSQPTQTIAISDNDAPQLSEYPTANPTTGDSYNLTINVTDNISPPLSLTVYLNYYWATTTGDTSWSNVSMVYDSDTKLFYYVLTVPNNAQILYWNVSAKDTSNNWNETGQISITVIDNNKPQITDTSAGTLATGDSFTITATVIDNIGVDEVRLYYYYDTTTGPTSAQNVSMNDLGGGNYDYMISVPANALTLYYNISANDTINNWNETGLVPDTVLDDDWPDIIETTTTAANTGEYYNLTAVVTDNIAVNTVWLDYNMTSIDGYETNNVSMNPSYWYNITLWDNATWFNYTISANDTSDNWNTSTNNVAVNDNDLSQITDTTVGTPTTGETFTITATVTDNVVIDEVHLYYYFDTVAGPTTPQNVTMNDLGGGNYDYTIPVPANALVLYYNISANDTSNNWNETGEITRSITDNDLPEIADTTSGVPTTGETFTITATVIDDIAVYETHVFYYFATTTGPTSPQNVTMNDLGGGNYDYTVSVPSNALTLYYNISANDTTDNWNETGITSIGVLDNDLPQIIDTTVGIPTTGEAFTITATVTDDVAVDEIHLYYYFDTTIGPSTPQNVTMNDLGAGDYDYTISVPINALTLYYNITANDTSNNWNETGEINLNIIDNDLPELIDTTPGIPTTEDPFTITVTVTDDVNVDEVRLYYYYDTTTGPTFAQNVTMNDLGGGDYDCIISVPANALTLYYNISANDTSDNWNETGEVAQSVTDNDLPEIVDTTSGVPTTEETFTITATVTDNIGLGEVHLYYYFDTTTGSTPSQNVTMNDLGGGNYDYTVSVPNNALTLYYNISANDTSNSWNETGIISIVIQDNDLPQIIDTTIGTPTTGDSFTITTTITDNVAVDEGYFYYYFDTTSGSTSVQNVSMNDLGGGNYDYTISVPGNALTLYYNISANDTTNNWNETGLLPITVVDNDRPEITDTTVGTPTTGDSFTITATVIDNIGVDEVHLYYYFNTVAGPTIPQNVTMNDLGGGNFDYVITVPADALTLYYNISANDTTNNWNQTGEISVSITDNDIPASTCSVAGYWFNSTPLTISWSASDNVDLASIELFYQHSADNGSWGNWISFDIQPTSGLSDSGTFSFTWPNGDGYYRFVTNVSDMEGNMENPPGYDDSGAYDTTTPTSTMTLGSPQFTSFETYVTSSTPINLTATDGSGAGVSSTWYKIWNDGSWTAWTLYTGDFTIPGSYVDGFCYINYNSTDALDQNEPVKNDTVILDNTDPILISVIDLVENSNYIFYTGAMMYYSNDQPMSDMFTIQISASDGSGSGLDRAVGETLFGESNPTDTTYVGMFEINYTINQNEDGGLSILISVYDNLGHMNTTELQLSLDNLAPDLSITGVSSNYLEYFYEATFASIYYFSDDDGITHTLTIDGTFSDADSGSQNVSFEAGIFGDSPSSITASPFSTSEYTIEPLVHTTDTLTVTAYDRVGNPRSITITFIEDNVIIGSVSSIEENSEYLFSPDLSTVYFGDDMIGAQYFYINSTFTDSGSGVYNVTYSPWGDDNPPTEYNPPWNATYTAGGSDVTGTITITYRDKVNNTFTITINIVRDTAVSTVNVFAINEIFNTKYLYAIGSTLYYNNNFASSFSIDIDASDTGSGLNLANFEIAFGEGGDDTIENPSPVVYTMTYTIEIGAIYSEALTITIYDNVGNFQTVDAMIILDVQEPTIETVTLVENSMYLYWDGNTLYYSNDQVMSELFTIQVTSFEGGSGLWKGVGESNFGETLPTDTDYSDSKFDISYTIDQTEDGGNELTIWVYDNVNNMNSTTISLELDNDISGFINWIIETSPYLYFSDLSQLFFGDDMGAVPQSFTVNSTFTDGGAGMYSVTYTSWGDDSPATNYNSPWQATYDVETGDVSGIITIIYRDRVNNTAQDTITLTRDIDITGSVTSIEEYSQYVFVEDLATIYFGDDMLSAQDFFINSTFSDASSGTYNVSYSVWGDDAPLGDFNQPWSATYAANVGDVSDTIVITFRDNVNNSVTYTINLLRDITLPTASVWAINEIFNDQYLYVDGSTLYYNNIINSEFSIDVDASDTDSGLERANFESAFGDGGNDTSESAQPTVYSMTYTIEAGVTYSETLSIIVYDNVGNTFTINVIITLDITNPEIDLITTIIENSINIYFDGVTLYYSNDQSMSDVFTIWLTCSDIGSGPWKAVGESQFGESDPTDTTYVARFEATYTIHQNENGGAGLTITIYDQVSNINTTELLLSLDNDVFGQVSSIDETSSYIYVSSLSQVYFGDDMSTTQTITITSTFTDAISGTYSVSYSTWGDDSPSTNFNSPWQATYTVDITDTNGTITIRYYDRVNNMAIDIISLIRDIEISGSVTSIEENNQYVFVKDLSTIYFGDDMVDPQAFYINSTFTDSGSGVYKITYSGWGDDAPPVNYNSPWAATYTAYVGDIGGTIVVTYWDEVNNSVSYTITLIKDIIQPTVNIHAISDIFNSQYLYVDGSTIYYNNISSTEFSIDINASDVDSGLSYAHFEEVFGEGGMITSEGVSPKVYSMDYSTEIGANNSGSLSIIVYDNVGNSKEVNFLIILDVEKPTIETMTLVESSPYLYWNGNTLYYSNNQEMDEPFTVQITGFDNSSGLWKVMGESLFGDTLPQDTDYSDFKFDILYIVNKNEDGDLSIELTLYDQVSNWNSTILPLVLDNNPPDITQTIETVNQIGEVAYSNQFQIWLNGTFEDYSSGLNPDSIIIQISNGTGTSYELPSNLIYINVTEWRALIDVNAFPSVPISFWKYVQVKTSVEDLTGNLGITRVINLAIEQSPPQIIEPAFNINEDTIAPIIIFTITDESPIMDRFVSVTLTDGTAIMSNWTTIGNNQLSVTISEDMSEYAGQELRINVFVLDAAGNENMTVFSITVALVNHPPIFRLKVLSGPEYKLIDYLYMRTGNSLKQDEGYLIFDASYFVDDNGTSWNQDDRDGGLRNLTWYCDGEIIGYGSSVLVSFLESGSHQIEIKSIDEHGNEDSTTFIVNVKVSHYYNSTLLLVILILLTILLCSLFAAYKHYF